MKTLITLSIVLLLLCCGFAKAQTDSTNEKWRKAFLSGKQYSDILLFRPDDIVIIDSAAAIQVLRFLLNGYEQLNDVLREQLEQDENLISIQKRIIEMLKEDYNKNNPNWQL